MPEPEARILCRYCGANNFAGTLNCWQCNRLLQASQKSPEPSALAAASTPLQYGTPGRSAGEPSFAVPVDESIADKAAIALGLLFPVVGYTVGIVFMMLDDRRKIQLGRATILWSTIGLVITLVASLLATAPLLALGKQLLPSSSSSRIADPLEDSN